MFGLGVAFILKNDIASRNHAMSCTNAPGTVAIARVSKDAAPDAACIANTIPSAIVSKPPANKTLAAVLNKGTRDLSSNMLNAVKLNIRP